MSVGVKINGENNWCNTTFSTNALKLFRFKVVEDSAWSSYKGVNGVAMLRIFRSSPDENYYHDVMVRLSTRSETDKTPYIKVFDKDTHSFRGWSYKIILYSDGYAYFVVNGSNDYENYKYQILYSTRPSFFEYLNEPISKSEYLNPQNALQIVTPSSGFLEPPTISFNANYGLNSTSTLFSPLVAKTIESGMYLLAGNMFIYNAVTKKTKIMSISKKTSNKPFIFYVDVYNVTTDESINNFDSTQCKRICLYCNTLGEIITLDDINGNSYINFNNILLLDD